MEQLRWEFEMCAARITEASESIRIDLRKYAVIDREKWANVRLGLSAEQPVFFAMSAKIGDRERSYDFVFQKSGSSSEMLQAVSLSGIQLARSPVSTITMTGSDIHTSLPEFSVWIGTAVAVDDGFVMVLCDAESQATTTHSPLAPMRVAQEFLREIVLRRLT